MVFAWVLYLAVAALLLKLVDLFRQATSALLAICAVRAAPCSHAVAPPPSLPLAKHSWGSRFYNSAVARKNKKEGVNPGPRAPLSVTAPPAAPAARLQ